MIAALLIAILPFFLAIRTLILGGEAVSLAPGGGLLLGYANTWPAHFQVFQPILQLQGDGRVTLANEI